MAAIDKRRSPSIEAQTIWIVNLGFAVPIAISILLILIGPSVVRALINRTSVQLVVGNELGLTALAVAAVLAVSTVITLALINYAVIKRLKREIESRAAELAAQRSALTSQLRETAAQEERNRLARDLHDTIKQQLFSINVAAATAQSLRERDPEAAAQQIQQVRDLSQAASVEMKALLTQLRPQPLAAIGLVGAIQEQLDALQFRSEVQGELYCDAIPDESRLPLGAQEAIFRVVQEALANVARHARAKRAVVTINPHPQPLSTSTWERGGSLRVTIQDDGQGFDPANGKAGMGMSNMRARVDELGGTFAVQSAPHLGTMITIDVPLIQAEQTRERNRHRKEECYEQVYWASSLTSLTAALVLVVGFVLALFVREMLAGNTQLWSATTIIFTLGAALCLPFIFATLSFRRRVHTLAGDSDIWPKLLRSYDVMQLAYLGLLCALVLLSLKQFVWGGIAAFGAAVALTAALRANREINTRIREWATYRMLRTRRNEQMVFIGLGLAFIILILSGLYGDVRQTKFLHDEINSEWFASFMTLIYPLLMCSTALGLISLQRQMNTLQADRLDDPDAATAPSDMSLRQARIAASLLAFGYGAILVPLAGASLFSGRGDTAAVIAGLAVVILFAKWRIERRLTARIAEWSHLQVQNSAMTVYSIFLALALCGIMGAVIGYLAATATPDAADSVPQVRRSPAAIGATASLFAGVPFYLFLMTAQTWQRIKRLKTLTIR